MPNPTFVKLTTDKELNLIRPADEGVDGVTIISYQVGAAMCAADQEGADGLIEAGFCEEFEAGQFVPLKVVNNSLVLTWVDPETQEGRTIYDYPIGAAVLAPDAATATVWVQCGYCAHFSAEME